MNPILQIASGAQEVLRGLYMAACRALPIERDKAVFASFSGKAYSDNSRAVSEALHQLRPDCDIVWLMRDPEAKRNILPRYVRAARIHSAAAIRELATAKAWVDNAPKPLYTKKRAGQLYIQTWHGDRGFKKILYEAPDHPAGKPVLEQHIADVMVSGSRHADGVYHSAFRYAGETLRVGSPRNDALLNPPPGLAAQVKRALGFDPGDKLLLYAPTMRNAARRQGKKQRIQDIDLIATLDALQRRFGGRWVCAVRAHSTQLGLEGFPLRDRIADASPYEDMADLLVASDMLITDYSSSAGDFPLTGRPVALFISDIEQFAREERSFYYDIPSTPFVCVGSQRQLNAHIAQLTPEQAEENDRQILSFFGAFESGEASKRVAEMIAKAMS